MPSLTYLHLYVDLPRWPIAGATTRVFAIHSLNTSKYSSLFHIHRPGAKRAEGSDYGVYRSPLVKTVLRTV
jgi:hypothetical protein